jgi:hypothetical protein
MKLHLVVLLGLLCGCASNSNQVGMDHRRLSDEELDDVIPPYFLLSEFGVAEMRKLIEFKDVASPDFSGYVKWQSHENRTAWIDSKRGVILVQNGNGIAIQISGFPRKLGRLDGAIWSTVFQVPLIQDKVQFSARFSWSFHDSTNIYIDLDNRKVLEVESWFGN